MILAVLVLLAYQFFATNAFPTEFNNYVDNDTPSEVEPLAPSDAELIQLPELYGPLREKRDQKIRPIGKIYHAKEVAADSVAKPTPPTNIHDSHLANSEARPQHSFAPMSESFAAPNKVKSDLHGATDVAADWQSALFAGAMVPTKVEGPFAAYETMKKRLDDGDDVAKPEGDVRPPVTAAGPTTPAMNPDVPMAIRFSNPSLGYDFILTVYHQPPKVCFKKMVSSEPTKCILFGRNATRTKDQGVRQVSVADPNIGSGSPAKDQSSTKAYVAGQTDTSSPFDKPTTKALPNGELSQYSDRKVDSAAEGGRVDNGLGGPEAGASTNASSLALKIDGSVPCINSSDSGLAPVRPQQRAAATPSHPSSGSGTESTIGITEIDAVTADQMRTPASGDSSRVLERDDWKIGFESANSSGSSANENDGSMSAKEVNHYTIEEVRKLAQYVQQMESSMKTDSTKTDLSIDSTATTASSATVWSSEKSSTESWKTEVTTTMTTTNPEKPAQRHLEDPDDAVVDSDVKRRPTASTAAKKTVPEDVLERVDKLSQALAQMIVQQLSKQANSPAEDSSSGFAPTSDVQPASYYAAPQTGRTEDGVVDEAIDDDDDESAAAGRPILMPASQAMAMNGARADDDEFEAPEMYFAAQQLANGRPDLAGRRMLDDRSAGLMSVPVAPPLSFAFEGYVPEPATYPHSTSFTSSGGFVGYPSYVQSIGL